MTRCCYLDLAPLARLMCVATDRGEGTYPAVLPVLHIVREPVDNVWSLGVEIVWHYNSWRVELAHDRAGPGHMQCPCGTLIRVCLPP